MGPDHASRTTRTIIDLPCCAEPQVPPLYRRNRWCLWAPGAATESPIIDPGVHAEAAVRYTPTVVTTLLLLVGALIGAGATLLAPVSYTHLRAHETVLDLVCRLLLEKK